MENQNNNKDCGCDTNCCQPAKKGNLWTKILFVVIMLAVVSIINVKLVGKDNNQKLVSPANAKTKDVNCADSAKKACDKVCDPSSSSSCCPQSKN